MAARTHLHSFATRLLLAFLILIVLTALSTSIPAYQLTRRQLEDQAWKNVHNARQATLSLLQAEETRLGNLASLLAERPTLQQLIQADRPEELLNYLQNFQMQSNLDVLFLCQSGQLLAGSDDDASFCAGSLPEGAVWLNGRPALIAAQAIPDPANSQPTTTIVGRWLDHEILQQLAEATGVTQSVLQDDGTRLAASLETVSPPSGPPPQGFTDTQLTLNDEPYFATYAPLGSTSGLLIEVALPVSELIATGNQALLLLAISTSLVAILGVFGGGLYLGQLIAPLQKLTDVAEQISGGDLMTPIPLFSGPTEISTLAVALHQSQASMLGALAEQEQARDWLNTLIQSIVEGVVTVAADGRITFFSQGAETLTGWTAAAAIGAAVNEVFPVAEAGNPPFLMQLPATGSKRQIAVYTRQGQRIVLAVTGAPLTAKGITAEKALVLRDVTQEEALRHLRSYFLANISHEFRTPLSTLQASMELLLDEQENLSGTEMRQLLKPSYLSLSSLQTLIDNLLESSSIEAGEFVIRSQSFPFQAALTDALHIVTPLLERRQQAIALHQPDHLPDIQADPARITQVMVNLLTNASKYSPLGTIITIDVALAADNVRVSISDQGPGIPAAERDNLFRSFVRLDSVDREQYGIGLGLYVVKRVVEAHNGRVGIEDAAGGGSTFWFELPLEVERKSLTQRREDAKN